MTEMENDSSIKDGLDDDDDCNAMEMLIEAVKTHPLLFTSSHKDYKLHGKREIIWEQISQSLGNDVIWCKSKWRYLRNNYMVKKKLLKGKSGDAARRIKKWAYFKFLTFLDSSIEDAETSGNVEKALDENPEAEGDVHDDSSSQVEPESYATPVKKRKSSGGDPVGEALIKYMEVQGQKSAEVSDSHHYFGMDVAANLREFPDHAASYAKMKIQQVIYEVQRKLMYPDEDNDPDSVRF